MTDTNTPVPTDAEILDAAEDFRSQHTRGGTTFYEFDEIGYTRAVLAKWGAQPAAAQPTHALDAQRLTEASLDISTVLLVEGMDLEIGSRKLLKDAREAIDAARAARGAAQAAPVDAAAQKDAARYRFLRDGDWRDTGLERYIVLQLGLMWDDKIDAAIAAQKGAPDAS